MNSTERARPTRAQRRARAIARAQAAERNRQRRREHGQTRTGIQLDTPDSVDEWEAGQRPRCSSCGNPARWSTVVQAWCHADYHPDYQPELVDARPHNVGAPEWVPLEYAGEPRP